VARGLRWLLIRRRSRGVGDETYAELLAGHPGTKPDHTRNTTMRSATVLEINSTRYIRIRVDVHSVSPDSPAATLIHS
jgi:hypothetical protein